MSQSVMGKFTRTFALHLEELKAVQLVAEDLNRICVFVQNLGAVDVYILSAQNLSVSDGIRVSPDGTYKNDTTTAALWIIADGENHLVRVEVDGN